MGPVLLDVATGAQIDLDRNVQQVYHWLKHTLDELHFRIALNRSSLAA
jgi:hypothetical protein